MVAIKVRNYVIGFHPIKVTYNGQQIVAKGDKKERVLIGIGFPLASLNELITEIKVVEESMTANGSVVLGIYLMVNVEKLYEYVSHSSDDNFPHSGALINALHQHYNECIDDVENEIVKEISKPVDYKVTSDKVTGLNINLYSYQIKNIKWMKMVEDTMNVPIEVSTNNFMLLQDGDYKVYVDRFHRPENGRMFRLDVPPYNSFMIFRGGCLIDQMGFGKTATSIVHSLKNNKFDAGTLSPYQYYSTHGYVPCKATVIFTKNYLVKQWCDEFTKIVPASKKLNIVKLTIKKDMETVTYNDLLNADFVVVSYNLRQNPTFQSMYSNILNGNRQYGVDHSIQPVLKKMYDTIISGGTGIITEENFNKFLRRNMPYVTFFKWNRIIYDEAHDLYKKYRERCIRDVNYLVLHDIKCNYKWFVTGTPVADIQNYYCICSLLIDIIDPLNYLNNSKFALISNKNIILPRMFRRNAAESVSKEVKLPQMRRHTAFIDFSDAERILYNFMKMSVGEQDLLTKQLCTIPQLIPFLRNCKNVEEIKDILVDYTLREKSILETEMVYTQQVMYDTSVIHSHHAIAGYQRAIQNRQEEIKRKEKSLAYLLEQEVRTAPITKTCSCCKSKLINKVALCVCGVNVCIPCLEGSKQCPKCNRKIKKTSLKEHAITSKYGSKMAKLILFIKKCIADGHNIIVFSQWHDVLHKVGIILQDNKINNVFVEGNIHKCNKELTAFNEDEDCHVLMMSSKRNNSGANLTKANIIIFVDPVYATVEGEKNNTESQAICRALRIGQKKDIDVYHIVVKGTIEEKVYNTFDDEADDEETATNNEEKKAFIIDTITEKRKRVRSKATDAL